MGYKPRTQRNKDILDRAFHHIQSVPYKVSLRWVFYRLLQDRFYTDKGQYNTHWKDIAKKARRGYYKEWRPDTLKDDTRWSDIQGWGYDSPEQWLEKLKPECYLDRNQHQDHYIELWFEARAMFDQFKYYTEHITLAPMGGSPSLSYLWDLAKRLERAEQIYQLPITVLYFGDHDDKGSEIYTTVKRDMRDWCEADIDVVWCGLTREQVIAYEVPKDEKGKYQWEALSDEGAREIITQRVEQFHSLGGDLEQQEQEAEQFVKDKLRDIKEQWESR